MTTIFFPDVSKYNNVQIQPGTVVVVARATLSSSYFDDKYLEFQREAQAVGAFFVAYHWLNHAAIATQAHWAYVHVGQTPLMLDCEDMVGNTGYSGILTVQDILDFVKQYRAIGGVCNLVYLPHWYWSGHMGSPDLTPLVQAGLHLVSSNYTTYSDTGPGWAAYGHMNPEEWQYTDALPYGGSTVDFNAFKGTLQDFIAMATGDVVPLPIVPTPQRTDDMLTHWVSVSRGSTGSHVRVWQGLLCGHSYTVAIDGDFGPDTDAKTRKFQSDKGISVDGIAGPHSLSMALYDVDYAG